jgi:phosphoribosylamine--glycine ligase
MRTLIVGQGGRESALAWKMSEASCLYAFMKHENPSIIRYVNESGGKYTLGNITDPQAVAAYAVAEKIDLVMVSSDEPLAAGVVDALLQAGINTVGPTKAGAEIEWNKEFSREIVSQVAPEANPFFRVAHDKAAVEIIFAEIGDMPVVIKPVGLTGGKGVKVMGPHLANKAAARAYALEILEAGIGGGNAVIIEERMQGAEFTIQAMTDGDCVIMPPATYDYPYRHIDDTGPGTGGMGSYSVKENNLPFMTLAHYETATQIIRKVIAKLKALGRHYNGAMNAGFFLTQSGEVKVIEFNSRFGDPECMNIMLLLESNLIEIMQKITQKSLSVNDIQFKNAASLVIYLVAPEYGLGASSKNYKFTVNVDEIENNGSKVFFSSAKSLPEPNTYLTVGVSRSIAVGCTAQTLEDAHAKMAAAISSQITGELEWRKDVGTTRNINFIKMKLDVETELTS